MYLQLNILDFLEKHASMSATESIHRVYLTYYHVADDTKFTCCYNTAVKFGFKLMTV